MNNQQDGCVILWLTWQKYETMYQLLTYMTLYFSDHFSLLVELAMPWPLGNMTAFAGQPVTTVGSGVQQPYQPSQTVNIYSCFYQTSCLNPKKQIFQKKCS